MICEKCGHDIQVGDFPFCKGQQWQHEKGWTNVIGDACDFVSNNGEKHPVRFRSKIEHRRWLKEKGYAIKDEHKGLQGSDKSPHTTKWQGGGKEWLANAEALASRHGGVGTKEPEDEPLHVTWTSGELTPAQVEEYRAKNR